jgi:hypothetical protein
MYNVCDLEDFVPKNNRKKNICTAFSSIAHFIIEDQHEQGLFDGRYDYSETS